MRWHWIKNLKFIKEVSINDKEKYGDSISNQSINGQNGNSYFDKTSDNNKSDKSNNVEESGIYNTFNFENEFNRSPEIQKLYDEINKINKENKEREEKAEKRFQHLENQNNVLKNEISKINAKLDEVSEALGLI